MTSHSPFVADVALFLFLATINHIIADDIFVPYISCATVAHAAPETHLLHGDALAQEVLSMCSFRDHTGCKKISRSFHVSYGGTLPRLLVTKTAHGQQICAMIFMLSLDDTPSAFPANNRRFGEENAPGMLSRDEPALCTHRHSGRTAFSNQIAHES